MVQIAVVANYTDFAEYIKNNLEIFFKPFADIHAYSVEDIKSIHFHRKDCRYFCLHNV